ncbi:MAG: class II fumarate hydratase [Planctomycetia bacterium]|nr:class II fumarate hydratase [Planctomycetia bacterium]
MNERIERDSMGEVCLPEMAYYGAQTQRAILNFPISGRPLPERMIRAMGLVKWAAASANRDLGLLGKTLSEQEIDAILAAALEVADGEFADQFPIDVYQTGSGTSSNMNVNEVIANRAMELSGGNRFEITKKIHPNDHVNMGQSTNDTFPTAIHVAVGTAIQRELVPALLEAVTVLDAKAEAWGEVLKIGRTHLADATPMTLGQEFSGFARQMQLALGAAQDARNALHELPVGGTAVGTGINTHPKFASLVCKYLAEETQIPFTEAANHFEANAQRDGLVRCHALLKSVAATLMNIANNIRWLGSGPRCGYHEITLPDLQPGSSIMPGKVNPVLCESLIQVAARVIGNDATVTTCGIVGGQFQLNISMPLLSSVTLESVEILSNGLNLFTKNCLAGLQANREQCEKGVEQSLSMVTSLNPLIGYEKAAKLAKEAFRTGKTIRELCREQKILPEEVLTRALDPMRMTRPLED